MPAVQLLAEAAQTWPAYSALQSAVETAAKALHAEDSLIRFALSRFPVTYKTPRSATKMVFAVVSFVMQ